MTDAALLAPAPSGALPPATGRPSFSVIMAAYQAESTIADALRTALTQTQPPLEVVVCDDGSTDGTPRILEGFGDRVRVLRQANSGASVAKNAAAEAASGDFVAIMDADDLWEPGRLERLGDLAAARPDVDLMTTDAWFLVDAARRGTFYQANGPFPIEDQATKILRRNYFFAHVAVRRSVWLKHGGFEPGRLQGEDWDFWLRLLFAGCLAGCVAEPLADYRIHPASLSADRTSSLMARVEVLDRAAATQPLTPAQRDVLAQARREYLHRARAAHTERALLDAAPDRRRASFELLRTPGTSPRARVQAAAAMLAPGWAGRRLRAQQAGRGRARTDRDIR